MVLAMTCTRILLILFAAVIILGSSGNALAQTEADVIAAVRAQLGANRQALVAENLKLAEEESDGFWPLYREFHNERDKLMDRRVTMLRDFRDNFDTLTNEQSKQIIDDYFQLQDDLLKLRKKYAKQFRTVLSDKRTLRYFQIENMIDTIIDFELVQMVPLAE
jgi:hypothetical protein